MRGLMIPASIIALLSAALSPAAAQGAADIAAEIARLEGDIAALRAGLDAQQLNSNHIWTMTAAALVLLMQVGFLFLEAGAVRSKNSINVAQKNVADFLISATMFYLVGFSVMFGHGIAGLLGDPSSLAAFAMMEDWSFTFFVFQAVFVGTAATIMSGAVAERMNFTGYIVMAGLLAAVIYPVFGYWAWGNLLDGGNAAWLADAGFIDFAGSTVVHSVGAWVALAGIVVLGPRIGRFDETGAPRPIQGHSMVLSAAGAVILLVGWIGFNGGSTTTGSPDFARIVANTILAAAFAGVAAMIAGRLYDGLFVPQRSINGMLAGLVGITAGCDAVAPHGAVAIGLMCGLVVVASEEIFLRWLKLDDVVGAVSVHGVCGALGTVLLAFFALPEKLAAAGPLAQAWVQLQGVSAAFLWTFGLAFLGFKAIEFTCGLRVSAEDELKGLNAAEHGTTLGTGELQERLHRITSIERDLTARLDETTGDETAEIAAILNPFLDEVHAVVSDLNRQSKAVAETASHLTALSRDSVDSASQVATGSESVNGSAATMTRRSEGLKSVAQEMAGESNRTRDMSGVMAQEIRAVSRAIEELAASVAAVGRDADVAADVAARAQEAVAAAHQAVGALADASSDIEGIVDLINDIAAKTNLLALNATIEASRAGEAGRGFAVVASEVKALSNQTTQATENIRRRVEHMKSNSSGATGLMGQVRDTIDTMTAMMSRILAATEAQRRTTEDIDGSARTAVNHADAVAATMEAMSQKIGHVAEVVTEMSGEAGVTHDHARRMADAAGTGLSSAHRINDTATTLDGVSAVLRSSATRYKVAG